MILTSNRGFGEWAENFGGPVVASALLDRLVHHAIVIAIEGDIRSEQARAQAPAFQPARVPFQRLAGQSVDHEFNLTPVAHLSPQPAANRMGRHQLRERGAQPADIARTCEQAPRYVEDDIDCGALAALEAPRPRWEQCWPPWRRRARQTLGGPRRPFYDPSSRQVIDRSAASMRRHSAPKALMTRLSRLLSNSTPHDRAHGN